MNKDTLFTVHRPVDPSVVKQPDTGRSKSSKDYWKNDLKVTIKEIMLVLAHTSQTDSVKFQLEC